MGADQPDISASLNGDDDAFGRIVARYQPVIFRQMWRFSRDPVVVEELVQDVFVEVFRSLRGFRGKAPFLHWIRRIATRVGYRHWNREQRGRRMQELLERTHYEAIARPEAGPASEAADALFALLSTLPAKDRLVLTLIYFEDYTANEVAAETGWSETLVRVRSHRARQKLKKKLENLGQSRGQ